MQRTFCDAKTATKQPSLSVVRVCMYVCVHMHACVYVCVCVLTIIYTLLEASFMYIYVVTIDWT